MSGELELFVNGTLMRGLELHANLAGARFLGEAETEPAYRLWAIDGRYPAMLPAGEGAAAIAGELYALDLAQLERLLAGEPPGLGLGVVRLAGGRRALGIVWAAGALPESAEEITGLRGWRAYRAAREGERRGGAASA